MTSSLPAAQPPSSKPPCLRASAALAVACVGLTIALVFGAISKAGDDDVSAGGQLLSGIAFFVLGILAFFQRSIEAQVIRLSEENDELHGTRVKLDETRADFDKENAELRDTHRKLDEENDELRATKQRFDEENEELRETKQRLDEENDELRASLVLLDEKNTEFATNNKDLSTQVRHLNQLHNDSVKMIRNLATYGDECKNFGRDLHGITDHLHETDDSLGLTAEEIKKQVAALTAVAAAMRRA